ncbi:hypothetical protein [Allosphingosinicella sp.]|uniref:hypothetical protein n=1 Tax=Allosphingosinicella sp. TaxID=2823234 RepID=UPI0037849D54
MKIDTVALIAAAFALAAADPAAAAAAAPTDAEAGLFAGFRLRLAVGASRAEPRLRGGFALAPTLHSRTDGGALRLRMGEGVEFGLRSDSAPAFSIAGTPVGLQRPGPGQNRSQLRDTTKVLVIGGAVLLAVGAALFWHALDEASD